MHAPRQAAHSCLSSSELHEHAADLFFPAFTKPRLLGQRDDSCGGHALTGNPDFANIEALSNE